MVGDLDGGALCSITFMVGALDGGAMCSITFMVGALDGGAMFINVYGWSFAHQRLWLELCVATR